MNLDITLVILTLAGIGAGLIIGIFSQKGKNAKILESTTLEANDILRNAKQKAERIKDEKMLQAKERFIELKSEHEKVIFQREKKISDVEGRLRDKENKLNNDLNKNKNLSQSLEQKNETLQKRLVKLEHKQNELDDSHKVQVQKLEVISGISAEEAKKELIESLKNKAQSEEIEFYKKKIIELEEKYESGRKIFNQQ